MTVELSAEERAKSDVMLADLHAHGYVDRERFNELAPGVRIRHRGHQWPDAYVRGTGVILAITERRDSSWSQSWGMPDVEMVVLWDRPHPFDDSTRLSQLAQYHVQMVRPS